LDSFGIRCRFFAADAERRDPVRQIVSPAISRRLITRHGYKTEPTKRSLWERKRIGLECLVGAKDPSVALRGILTKYVNGGCCGCNSLVIFERSRCNSADQDRSALMQDKSSRPEGLEESLSRPANPPLRFASFVLDLEACMLARGVRRGGPADAGRVRSLENVRGPPGAGDQPRRCWTPSPTGGSSRSTAASTF
jgi:hypothetical protein